MVGVSKANGGFVINRRRVYKTNHRVKKYLLCISLPKTIQFILSKISIPTESTLLSTPKKQLYDGDLHLRTISKQVLRKVTRILPEA